MLLLAIPRHVRAYWGLQVRVAMAWMEEAGCPPAGAWQEVMVTCENTERDVVRMRFTPSLVRWHNSDTFSSVDDHTIRVCTTGGVDLVRSGKIRISKMHCNTPREFRGEARLRSANDGYKVSAHVLRDFEVSTAKGFRTVYADELRKGQALARRLQSMADEAARRIQTAWRRCVSDPG